MAILTNSSVFNLAELLPGKAVRVKLDYTVNGNYEVDAVIKKAELTTVSLTFFNPATLKMEDFTVNIDDVQDGDKVITHLVPEVVVVPTP